MIKVEENKDQHNEISTSTNKLNEVETEDEKDKNDKITLEDLTNIISEPDDKKDDDNYDDHDHEHEHEHDQDHEKEHENEHEHDTHIRKKDSGDLSNDDMIESELRMIRKKIWINMYYLVISLNQIQNQKKNFQNNIKMIILLKDNYINLLEELYLYF